MTDLEEQITDMLRAQGDTFGISDDAWERTEARMNRRTPAWRPVAAVAAVAAACAAVPLTLSATGPPAQPPAVSGSAPQPAPSPSPTPARSSTTPSRSAAARELQAFLDSWRRDGQVIASRTYLVADQQVTDPADVLVLSKGRVAKVRSAMPSGGDLVLHVELDLTFRGATAAWGNGVNERFVTFTPRAGAVPFVMSLATSP